MIIENNLIRLEIVNNNMIIENNLIGLENVNNGVM